MRRSDRAALRNCQRILESALYDDRTARQLARIVLGRVLDGVEGRRLMGEIRAIAAEQRITPLTLGRPNI